MVAGSSVGAREAHDEAPAAALAALFGSDGARAFAGPHWPHHPFVVHRTLSQLPSALRAPLLLDPRALAAVYRGTVEVTNGRAGQFRLSGVDPNVYFEVLGLATRFSELQQYVPQAASYLRELEAALGAPNGCASLHAFVNPAHVGLAAHCDPAEHIAVQLAGKKRFKVLRNEVPYAAVSHGARRPPSRRTLATIGGHLPRWERLPETAETIDLEPGSVLFMPRGTYHETLGGEGEPSVTLVIQLAVPSAADVFLDYLRDYLAQATPWRQPLLHTWRGASPAAQAHLRDSLDDLAERLLRLSPQQMIDARSPALTLDYARLVRAPGVEVRVTIDDDQMCVQFVADDRRASAPVELAAELSSVFDWLLAQTDPFSLAAAQQALPEWEPDAIEAVAQFLLARGALLSLPIEPFNA